MAFGDYLARIEEKNNTGAAEQYFAYRKEDHLELYSVTLPPKHSHSREKVRQASHLIISIKKTIIANYAPETEIEAVHAVGLLGLHEYLSNAWDAAEEGSRPKVMISLIAPNKDCDLARFIVEDNGKGVEALKPIVINDPTITNVASEKKKDASKIGGAGAGLHQTFRHLERVTKGNSAKNCVILKNKRPLDGALLTIEGESHYTTLDEARFQLELLKSGTNIGGGQTTPDMDIELGAPPSSEPSLTPPPSFSPYNENSVEEDIEPCSSFQTLSPWGGSVEPACRLSFDEEPSHKATDPGKSKFSTPFHLYLGKDPIEGGFAHKRQRVLAAKESKDNTPEIKRRLGSLAPSLGDE